MTCCCSGDSTRAPLGASDVGKHVNYVLGMVLGVNDLTDEFAYLNNRVESVAREVVGYGTDRGLAVRVEIGDNGPRVQVTPGVAYAPTGNLICVGADQCCTLNDWLRSNARALNDRFGALDQATARLYVTLCYRECLTDKVPIPGEPCRSEDALMSPSRVKDDFSLELRFTPPRQTEEDAVREFVRWLRAVPVHDQSPAASIEDLLDAIRAAASPWLDLASPVDCCCDGASPIDRSPLDASPLDFMLGDTPAGLAIPQDACVEFLRAAFRVWVTELRPVWIARFGGCHAGCCKPCPGDDCVLLAALDVPIILQSPALWEVSDVDPVTVDESCRPYLLHVRLLQEWLLAMCACGAAEPPPLPDLGGDLSGPITQGTVHSIQGIGVVATGAAAGQLLGFDGTQWTPRDETVPVVPPLAGDVVGPVGSNRVQRIHGFNVQLPTGADAGSALVFEGTDWQLKPVADTGPCVTYPATEIGYSIVAAGRFGFQVDNSRARVAPFTYDASAGLPNRTFNNLRVVVQPSTVVFPVPVWFIFDDYLNFLRSGTLIVKVTPGWLLEQVEFRRTFPDNGRQTRGSFQIFFSRFLNRGFELLFNGSAGSLTEVQVGEMEIEVGWYPETRDR